MVETVTETLAFIRSQWSSQDVHQDIEVTALDVCKNYVVIGSKYGYLHFYSTETHKRQHRIATGDETITEISISSDFGYLAYANTSGRAFVLKVPYITSKKKLYPVASDEHIGSIVTAIAWTEDCCDIYLGDDRGSVSTMHVPTNLASSLIMNTSSKLLDLNSPIKHMSLRGDLLLISTMTQSYIFHTKLETYRPLGTKLRKGDFGSSFFLERHSMHSSHFGQKTMKKSSSFWNNKFLNLIGDSDVQSETITDNGRLVSKVICALPRSRLCKYNLYGNVISISQTSSEIEKCLTISWNDVTNCIDSSVTTLPDHPEDISSLSFRQLCQFDPENMIGVSHYGIYLIEMETFLIKASLQMHQKILKAKFCGNTVLLLNVDHSVEKIEVRTVSSDLNQLESLWYSQSSTCTLYVFDEEFIADNYHIVETRHSPVNVTNCPTSDDINSLKDINSNYSLYVHEVTSFQNDVEDYPVLTCVENCPEGFLSFREEKAQNPMTDFLEKTSLIQMKPLEINELAIWLDDYLHFNDSYISSSEIYSSHIVTKTFLLCMKYHVTADRHKKIMEPQRCYKWTPMNVRLNDILYSDMIDRDMGLLDAIFLMNNLSSIGHNLYPLVWSSLLEKIAQKMSDFSELDVDELDKSSLTRSTLTMYLSRFIDCNSLQEFLQVSVILQHDHVIEDFLYFVFCLEPLLSDSETFRENMLYEYLRAFDQAPYYYQFYWSSSPELQYEIIKSILRRRSLVCPCEKPVFYEKKIRNLLDTIFSLPLYNVSEIFHLCLSAHYFSGILAIAASLSPLLVLQTLPLLFQFGNEPDVVKFVQAVPSDMYGEIIKYFSHQQCKMECVLCGNMLTERLSLDESGSFITTNYHAEKISETFLNAILSQSGPGTVLGVLKKHESALPTLRKRFYQKCIQAQLLLMKNDGFDGKRMEPYIMSPGTEKKIHDQQNLQSGNREEIVSILSYSLKSYIREELWTNRHNFHSLELEERSDSLELKCHENANKYCHWGIKVSLSGRCRLCTLDLTITAMIQAGGLTVFPCGCVMHSACSHKSFCPCSLSNYQNTV